VFHNGLNGTSATRTSVSSRRGNADPPPPPVPVGTQTSNFFKSKKGTKTSNAQSRLHPCTSCGTSGQMVSTGGTSTRQHRIYSCILTQRHDLDTNNSTAHYRERARKRALPATRDYPRRTTHNERQEFASTTTNNERRTTNEGTTNEGTTNEGTTNEGTTNDERRTTNDERRTTNDERRTTNDDRE